MIVLFCGKRLFNGGQVLSFSSQIFPQGLVGSTVLLEKGDDFG
jgi:hypothetical protein